MSRRCLNSLRIANRRWDPLRSPAWRWELACELASQPAGSRPGRADALLGHVVRYLRRLGRCRTPGRRTLVVAGAPELQGAINIYRVGGWRRTLVEAWILTGAKAAEIAVSLGMQARIVELYGSLFFDVADRLTARGYITMVIGVESLAATMTDQLASIVKRFAYYRGASALSLLLLHAFDHRGVIRRDRLDLQTADGRLAARLRLAVAVMQPSTSRSYLRQIEKNLVAICEIEVRSAALESKLALVTLGKPLAVEIHTTKSSSDATSIITEHGECVLAKGVACVAA